MNEGSSGAHQSGQRQRTNIEVVQYSKKDNVNYIPYFDEMTFKGDEGEETKNKTNSTRLNCFLPDYSRQKRLKGPTQPLQQ